MNTPSFENTFICPPGFRASGIHAGIKPQPGVLDMAMLVSDEPETRVAGMFTTNKVQAAPVKLGRERVADGTAQAVVVNSGNANAATGPQGMEDARTMGRLTAEALGLEEHRVLVCSTGSIGKPLNMEPIRKGIPLLVQELSASGGAVAAEGILTTDTRSKMCSTKIQIDGKEVVVGGFCKGAGMIEPNMATMLAYICTNAAVEADALGTALKVAVDASFNKISIDGDTSTNDSVFLLANGRAGNRPLNPDHPDWTVFQTALNGVIFDLAMKIVWDGEGMTKFIELRGEGFVTDAEADKALRAVANSFLVKTGWAGTYPAWSRVVDVLGYCGVEIDPDGLSIWTNDMAHLDKGVPGKPDPEALKAVLSGNRYTVTVNAGTGGPGKAVLYTCDCTEEYVRINMF